METTTTNHAALVAQYFAVWNETDAERRRVLIAQTWADDANYIDPLMQGAGHAGIDAMVQGVQTQFVGHKFHQTGALDEHNDRVRFTWVLAPENGPMVVAGTDFGIIAADGRLQAVTGFFDQTPAAPTT